jgi:glycosyltransferase involved in cell wall biosynthesis
MVVLEAMAHGKPIVVANSSESASRFYVQGNGFLFESTDAEDLAKKILKILKSDKLKLSMGEKSLKIVKGLEMSKSIDKLEKLYSSMLKENGKK